MFTVSFPGGVGVDATYRGHRIHTDQPQPLGADSAMAPFDLFWASMATCMGFYALRFCQERSIDTTGLALTLEPLREEGERRIARVKVALSLPEGFPSKYEDAVLRAIDHCAVKRTLAQPPDFDLSLERVTAVIA